MPLEQLGEHVAPVDPRSAHPGQVVEPDLVDHDLLGLDAEQLREVPLEADRHVAEPDRPVALVEQRPRDDADGVREVDDPGAVGGALARAASAISSTTGTVRSAFASPPAPVVSWPMQPHASGTVSSVRRAAWPPTRIWISTKSAPSSARSRSPVSSSPPS